MASFLFAHYLRGLSIKSNLFMKIKAEFIPVSQELLDQLATDLKGVLSEVDHNDFVTYVKPYEGFGSQQLDDIFLIAQVTVRGNGQVTELRPDCSVDQDNWWDVEDEPDIRIDPVSIPLKVLTPVVPFEVKGSKTFPVVLMAEGNIWDSCKDLPAWIWEEHKFQFMLMFGLTAGDGKTHHGNGGDEYASQLIEF